MLRRRTVAAPGRTPGVILARRLGPDLRADLELGFSRLALPGAAREYLWDKAAPGPPVARFARTEQGWQEAWNALVGYEMRAAGR